MGLRDVEPSKGGDGLVVLHPIHFPDGDQVHGVLLLRLYISYVWLMA